MSDNEEVVSHLERYGAAVSQELERRRSRRVTDRVSRVRYLVAASIVLVALTATTIAIAASRTSAPAEIATQGLDPVDEPSSSEPVVEPANSGYFEVAGPPSGAENLFPAVSGNDAALLMWGGEDYDGDRVDGGSVYKASDGSWSLMSPSPLAGRSGSASVWTGSEFIVCCGSLTGPGSTDAGAAYSPSSDSWREIPPSPLGSVTLASAVWTGTEMVVVGGVRADGVGDANGTVAAFDPLSNSWRTLASPPATIEREPDVAWNGSVLLVWPREAGEASSLLTFDPVAETWTSSEIPEDLRPDGGTMATAENGTLVWGVRSDQTTVVGAWLANGATTWMAIPQPDLPPIVAGTGVSSGMSSMASGSKVIVWPGSAGSGGAASTDTAQILVFDTESMTWGTNITTSLPAAQHPPIVAVGDQIIVSTGGHLGIIPLDS